MFLARLFSAFSHLIIVATVRESREEREREGEGGGGGVAVVVGVSVFGRLPLNVDVFFRRTSARKKKNLKKHREVNG